MKDVWHRITGAVVDGHFVPSDRERMKAILAEYAGKRIEVALRRESTRRTLPQNDKIHVLVRRISDETGESMLRLKRLATLEALGLEQGTQKETILGREFLEVRHTSELSKTEASAVVENLEDKCKFLGIKPPTDDEVEVMA